MIEIIKKIEWFFYLLFFFWLGFIYAPQYAQQLDALTFFDIDSSMHVDSAIKTSFTHSSGWNGYGIGWYKTVNIVDFFVGPAVRIFLPYKISASSQLMLSFMLLNIATMSLMFYSFFKYAGNYGPARSKTFALRLTLISFMVLLLSPIWHKYIFRAYPDIFMTGLLGILFLSLLHFKKIRHYFIIGLLIGALISIKIPTILFIAPVLLFFAHWSMLHISSLVFGTGISFLLFSYPIQIEVINRILILLTGSNATLNSFRIPFDKIWLYNYSTNFVDLILPVFFCVGLCCLTGRRYKICSRDFIKTIVVSIFILIYFALNPVSIEYRHYVFIVLPLVVFIAIGSSSFLLAFFSHYEFNNLFSYAPRSVKIFKIFFYILILCYLFKESTIFDKDIQLALQVRNKCETEVVLFMNSLRNLKKDGVNRAFATPYIPNFPIEKNSWYSSDSAKIITPDYDLLVLSKFFMKRYKYSNEKSLNRTQKFFVKAYDNAEIANVSDQEYQLIYSGVYCPVVVYIKK